MFVSTPPGARPSTYINVRAECGDKTAHDVAPNAKATTKATIRHRKRSN
jgi:hypothetical protein